MNASKRARVFQTFQGSDDNYNLHLLMGNGTCSLTLLVVKQYRCKSIVFANRLAKPVNHNIIIHVSSGAVCEDKKL